MGRKMENSKLIGIYIITLAFLSLTIFYPPIESVSTSKIQIVKDSNSMAIHNHLVPQGKRAEYVVWDNGAYDNTSYGFTSLLDTSYPFNSQCADDFKFDSNILVTHVHWWGVFWNGVGTNPCDFNIIFYADDGTGNQPTGAGMNDPTSTALKVYQFLQVMGTDVGDIFEYEVALPEPFLAEKETKYWIAIQAEFFFYDYGLWGWETNGNNPEKLHTALQGFPLIDVPYWTIIEEGDMAFYLISNTVPPPPPPVIHGPSNGIVNIEYTFWTDPITYPAGDPLYCRWEWGDGTGTDWLGPYPSGSNISASYTWTYGGVFEIRAKLKGGGGESPWSDPHTITIVQNEPPDTPSITGPSHGKPGTSYSFTFVTTDPDGDEVYYFIDWGDNTSSGWIGPYNPGQEETANHSWSQKGTYTIQIKAKDIQGAESWGWGTLSVKIPCSYNIFVLSFFNWLFEKLPHAFPILRYLLTF
jgi:hypothetical protein